MKSTGWGEGAVNALGRSMARIQFRGKGRVGLRLGGLAAHVSPRARCFPGAGASLEVDLQDRIQRLMWCGAYEPETRVIFRALLREGTVAVDVGAHVGYFTLLAGVLVGEQGSVHSFEPDPDCYAALRSNVAPWPRIVPRNQAVSDRCGVATLYRSPRPEESGWSSILGGGECREEIGVASITLDDWMHEQSVRRIDLLKIDAEGAEFRILTGSQELLSRHRPAVVFEANEECLGRDGRDLGDLIHLVQACGYVVWRVESRGRPTGTLLAFDPDKVPLPGDPRLRGVALARVP